MAKNKFDIFKTKKFKGSRPEGAGNFDNMDDYNIVEAIEIKEGTIQDTPTADKHIVNKEYVDNVVGSPKLNDIDNPDGNKSFTMSNKLLGFRYTAPSPSGDFGGAFEIEATGGFSGDLVHIHQHTGNPSSVNLLKIESEDSDATPLSVTANAATDAAIVVNTGYIDGHFQTYDTGWINRSDWTNVHLGTDTTKDADSNVTHSLGTPLSDILVKVLISVDGTDNKSFETLDVNIRAGALGSIQTGISVYQIDVNNLIVQTGLDGVAYISTNGTWNLVSTEDWYYKIKVYKLT